MKSIFFWNDLPSSSTAHRLKEECGTCFWEAPVVCWDKLSLAAQIDPDNPENWQLLAMCCDQAGDQSAAVSHYLRLIEKAPTTHSWMILGHYFVECGRHFEAAGAYAKAARLEPEEGGAWLHLGKTLLKRGKPGQAVRALEKATALSPDFNLAWLALAEAYERLGLSGKAKVARQRFASVPDPLLAFPTTGPAGLPLPS